MHKVLTIKNSHSISFRWLIRIKLQPQPQLETSRSADKECIGGTDTSYAQADENDTGEAVAAPVTETESEHNSLVSVELLLAQIFFTTYYFVE